MRIAPVCIAALVVACGQERQAAPAAPAGGPGDVAFRALGQEPGWILEIVPDRHIEFRYAYGEKQVATPVPEPVTSGNSTVYHAVTDAHDLRVTIEDVPCSDAMSGKPYEATVSVTLNGETWHGCGESP